VELGARAGNRAAIEALIGKPAADAFFANEVEHFPGRLGITHRDVPEMIARGYADVGLTQYHLISFWVRTFYLQLGAGRPCLMMPAPCPV
jgi:hypothetical protein